MPYTDATRAMAIRKVIQIVVMPQGVTESAALYALCDDGTIWAMNVGYPWGRVTAVPQSEAQP